MVQPGRFNDGWFHSRRLRTYWNVFSPRGWRPQQSQADTEGLESSWGATGLEEAGKAEEVGF